MVHSCKRMNQIVFKDSAIGDFCKKFYFHQSAMDKTNSQADPKLAAKLEKEYEIRSYPTYLFFDQNGKVVHKFVGATKASAFLAEAKNAMNSETQYYTMIDNFRSGNLVASKLKRFGISVKILR